MLPAHERFRADDAAARQVDLGLVVEMQFGAFQGAAQPILMDRPLQRADVHVGGEGNWQVLRPCTLARSIAASAFLISVSISLASSGKRLTRCSPKKRSPRLPARTGGPWRGGSSPDAGDVLRADDVRQE